MESPAPLVLSEETIFDAIFAEEDQPIGHSSEWLPIDKTAAAEMDLYNTDVLESWPVEPEEDHVIGLLPHDTSVAERREASEMVELFLTGRSSEIRRIVFSTTCHDPVGRASAAPLITRSDFRFPAGPPWPQVDFCLAADREEAKRLIQEENQ